MARCFIRQGNTFSTFYTQTALLVQYELTNDSSFVAQYSTNRNAGENPASHGMVHTHIRKGCLWDKYILGLNNLNRSSPTFSSGSRHLLGPPPWSAQSCWPNLPFIILQYTVNASMDSGAAHILTVVCSEFIAVTTHSELIIISFPYVLHLLHTGCLFTFFPEM